MKKITLVIFGLLILGSLIVGCTSTPTPACAEQTKWIETAQKGCDQYDDCTCSERNWLQQCVKCTCKTTETVCR